MRFSFFDVGARSPQNVTARLARLASFLVSDWIPTRPAVLAAGFVPLLDRVLQIGGAGTWTASQQITSFEKQWRQVTSWMIGVAFARDTVERLGYPFIAPVSAFTGGLSASATAAPHWREFYSRLESRIDKLNPALSRLLPDYVVGRIDPTTGMRAIAFVESKASRGSEPMALQCPDHWYKQARNAEFRWRGTLISAERNVVVATPVNPWAITERPRRVVVRVWNSEREVQPPPWEVMRELILAHYYGLLQSVGLVASCKAIELAVRERFQASAAPLLEDASRSEVEPHQDPSGATILLRRGAQPFELDRERLWVGVDASLTEALGKLLDRDAENAVRAFAEWHGEFRGLNQQREQASETLTARADAMIAFTQTY